MSLSNYVNSIGLLLDIVGVVLIWWFGLLEPISRSGAKYLITGQTDEKEKKKAERFHTLSKVGLGLVMFGFVLQLASNFL
jgi:hypothetical protein